MRNAPANRATPGKAPIHLEPESEAFVAALHARFAQRALTTLTHTIALLSVPLISVATAAELGPELQVNVVETGQQDLSAVAAGDDGSFLIAWRSTESDAGDLWVSRFTPGTCNNAGAFDGPVPIVSPAATLQYQPHLSPRNGGYWVTYSSDETDVSPLWEVFLQSLDLNGAVVGSSIQVSPDAPINCQEGASDISVDSAGNVAVYYSTYACTVDGDNDVHVRTFDSTGMPLISALKLNSYDAGEQHVARAAALGVNRFVAFWRGDSAADAAYGVSGRILDAGVPDGGEIQANQTIPGDQNEPVVIARPGGGFLVVWQGVSGTMPAVYGVIARFFDDDGNPDAGNPNEFFVNTEAMLPESGNPDIALGADGNYLVVWRFNDPVAGDSIHGQFLSQTGVKVGSEFPVSKPGDPGSYRDGVRVAADATGGFLVVWYGPDGDGEGVFARYIGPDTTCGNGIEEWNECCDLGPLNGTHLSGCSITCQPDPCPEGESCCGNGAIEPGEECDDGNTLDGDCCSHACEKECPDDGNPCTRDCDPANGMCNVADAPSTGCRIAGRSGLGLKAAPKGKVQWKWSKGENTYCDDVGAPDVDTDYDICIWDGTGNGTYTLESRFHVPAGPLWTERNCDWTYDDKTGAADGITKIRIKSGEPGRSSIGMAARVPKLPLTWSPPTPLSLTEFMDMNPNVVVQMHNSLGVCWESEFTEAKKNSGDKFRTNRLILLTQ